MPVRRFLIVLLVLVVASGCGTEEMAEASVAVENLRLVRQRDGSQAVSGVVVNSAEQERSVQVVVSLFDAANQRVGEIIVPVERIPARQQKGFDRTLDREAVGASVQRIVSF